MWLVGPAMVGERRGIGDRRPDFLDVDDLGRNDSLKAQNDLC